MCKCLCLRQCYSWNILFNRNGALGPIREWKLKDCISVHKLLATVLVDQDAASSKYHWDFLLLD